ncbi:hypothetical protein V1477_002363 [Vespula maculifrons]|uniref:Uncharacterized protein n=1 Tax=Vespula maculifrons TaxID=7453 RepID=A0ABD2CWA9_VESMC
MSSKLFRTKLFELSIFRKTGTYLIVLQYFVVAGANNAQRDSEMLEWYYKELGTFQNFRTVDSSEEKGLCRHFVFAERLESFCGGS